MCWFDDGTWPVVVLLAIRVGFESSRLASEFNLGFFFWPLVVISVLFFCCPLLLPVWSCPKSPSPHVICFGGAVTPCQSCLVFRHLPGNPSRSFLRTTASTPGVSLVTTSSVKLSVIALCGTCPLLYWHSAMCSVPGCEPNR